MTFEEQQIKVYNANINRGGEWRNKEGEYEYLYCEQEVYFLRNKKNETLHIVRAKSPKEAVSRLNTEEKWVDINVEKPPVGVPLIVTVYNEYARSKDKRQVLFPMYYVKSHHENEWHFFNTITGDVVNNVIAYMKVPIPWEGEYIID